MHILLPLLYVKKNQNFCDRVRWLGVTAAPPHTEQRDKQAEDGLVSVAAVA